MKNKILALALSICFAVTAFAGTPVEDLITEYETAPGAKDFKAAGAAMALGRTLLRKHPIAPLADDIDEMLILRMQKTSPEVQEHFVADLMEVMKDYEYFGKQETRQGIVDVYYLLGEDQIVHELIVYNPNIYALNCLRGNMDPVDLMKIHKPVKDK